MLLSYLDLFVCNCVCSCILIFFVSCFFLLLLYYVTRGFVNQNYRAYVQVINCKCPIVVVMRVMANNKCTEHVKKKKTKFNRDTYLLASSFLLSLFVVL